MVVEPCDDAVIIGQLVGNILFLHEEDEWFEDAVNVYLQIIVFFVDVLLQLLCDVFNLKKLLTIVLLLEAMRLDHQRISITIDDSHTAHAPHDVFGPQQSLPSHPGNQCS